MFYQPGRYIASKLLKAPATPWFDAVVRPSDGIFSISRSATTHLRRESRATSRP